MYIRYVALNDGYAENCEKEEIEPIDLGKAFENVIIPIYSGNIGVKFKRDYSVSGELTKKKALISLLENGTEIAVVAICLHSRPAKKLWHELISSSLVDLPDFGDEPPQAPWTSMRYNVPESELPEWLDYWCKSIAWSMIIHAGELTDE